MDNALSHLPDALYEPRQNPEKKAHNFSVIGSAGGSAYCYLRRWSAACYVRSRDGVVCVLVCTSIFGNGNRW